MPLFNKKFESKPIPARTGRCNTGFPPVSEDLDEFKNVSLSLGNKELKFTEGIWIHSTKKGDVDDITRLNRKLKSLEGQNNLNQVKVEILLDLLTENTLQLKAIQDESRKLGLLVHYLYGLDLIAQPLQIVFELRDLGMSKLFFAGSILDSPRLTSVRTR